MAKELTAILQEHSDTVDALVKEFTDKMSAIVDRASASVVQSVRSEVAAAGGLVESTVANQKFFAGLDDRFMAAMEAEGYSKLVESYVDSFNGQFEWFDKVIDFISSSLDNPLPKITFDRTDTAELNAYKLGSMDLIESAVSKAAGRARQQAMLSSGGMSVKDLTRQLQDSWATSVAESSNLADTSIATFYRTITDKGYQVIEADLPGFEIRYNYEGPLDKLNRPFCLKLEKLSRQGKTWTREMINKMNNGQLPNVFLTCGGFRCRHQWVISIPRDAKVTGKKAAPATKERSSREIRAQRALHSARMARVGGNPHPAAQIQAIREQTQQALAKARSAKNV